MTRDLLRESDQAAGMIRQYLKEVEHRRERYQLRLDSRELAELYNALARALSIATQLSGRYVQPEEYTAQALQKLVD
jgi:hypothetical protein